ncbi:M3 family oligoendopeptidase [Siccirubricoccus deserti]|uniref:M3 family oligoendopeptidase n=1 Tax=Siccirubricoccus deserti TaxID=2013562 RepID=A0A9X0QZD8_9PROT|nr:M3 family oligoendopeptidase [Siccirubricoccus deserti]MBC4016786.1 M3 family oligoendopeptidase [Siccirubricoccus deserti]GGC51363.1 M3 family oligoendopeptidase [Siccirubricoccus deserti]
MTQPPRFAELDFPTPTREGLAAEAAAVHARLDIGDLAGALAEWDRQRRDYDSWAALVHLRFSQDTMNAAARAAREYADALAPVATDHEVVLKRRLVALPDRAAVVAVAGAHALRLWETDITTFDPAISAELEEEARLGARYTELLASATLEIGGQVVNLSGLAPFAEDPDRAMRHRAEALRWGFFAEHGAALDGIYDQLVALRHGMAVKLGYENYIPLGYRRMRRVDYDAADVARYRDQVAEHVVPLVGRLLEARRQRQGWDRLRYWDEALIDPAGNPKPVGEHDTLVAQAQTMFDRMDPRLGGFYRLMEQGGFLDMRNRPGKAGGGFCTSFPSVGVPFIFANFNGTHYDIGVFTHEMGHAFQNWESRHQPGIDYLWPTMEAAEIHSMSLEFLTHPHMGLLVGEDAAERFRRMHLESSLAFLPYGVCVDHFQHEVYANPGVTPAERHAIWQRLERHYMPWTDYGDLGYPAKGGRWQAKPHIYRSPLYYIDYTLALCCAMQFWVKSRRDAPRALADYIALCGRGGAAPFQALVASAGLVSPFAPGALEAVVREAEAVLAA